MTNTHEETRERLRRTCEYLWKEQAQNAWLWVALMCSVFALICASIVAGYWYMEAQEDCKGQAGAAG